MAVLKPISQKQFKVQMDGQTVLFTKCTAPAMTFDENEYNDGETGQTQTQVGFMKLDKVTLTANYAPDKHDAFIAWFQDTYNKAPIDLTVTISIVNNDVAGTPLAGSKKLTMTGARITKFKFPFDVDREGSGLAMFEVEIVPGSVTFG